MVIPAGLFTAGLRSAGGEPVGAVIVGVWMLAVTAVVVTSHSCAAAAPMVTVRPYAVELVAPSDMPKRLPGETQKDWLRRLNKESGDNVRWYQTTKDVNGQKWYQRARDLQKPGTIAHWLADPKTSRAALEQAMGGGNAGSLRADWFLRQVNQKGMDPQRAYVDLLKFRGMTNRSVSPDRLARFKATAELPGINSITPRKPRRAINRKARPPR